ncbi:phosphate-regulating neutral endopeptidase PHEX-like [Drosophila takahashii]|uniref:phosphate-regulating neutral endopeptidase PHEX-like n=1 Tax=Drosophila takahashii TaxID=29030 RepID=UPI0038991F96
MKWIIGLLLVSTVSASRLPNVGSNLRILKNIIGSLNEDADACSDYFDFACGNYSVTHFDDPFPDMYQMLNHKLNVKLIKLIEEIGEKSLEASSVEAKVLRFYHNCREAPPETRQIEHYLRLTPPGEGLTWPPLTPSGTSWPKNQFKWLETLAYLSRFGPINVLIDIEISYNWQNSTEFLLNLNKSNAQIDSAEVRKILRSMGVPSERIQNIIRLLLKLDSDVSNLAQEDGRGQIMSVQRLNSATGYDWQRFIEIIVGHPIEPTLFRVEIENLPYLTAITQLVDSYDGELVAYYIMAGFVRYLQEDTEFGRDPLDCIQDVRRNMYVASNLLYREHFLTTLPLYTKEIQEIFEQIRHQLLLKIERNHLGLNAEQKKMIYGKVKNTVLNIGNMPKGRDLRSFADQHYEDLEISSADELDFAREHLKFMEFRNRKEMALLHQPDQNPKDYFDMPSRYFATSSGPYYLPISNAIIFPYGLLQEPYFLPDSHDVFKFSILGADLGHELMHAVDKDYMFVDSHGNHNEFGWEIRELPRFQEGLECMNRSWSAKLAERMADIGGLDLAYSAYFESGKIRDPTIIKKVSPEQMFFLNYAQAFCTDGYPEDDEDHDEAKLRLELIGSGAAPFDRAFDCRRNNTPCQLW